MLGNVILRIEDLVEQVVSDAVDGILDDSEGVSLIVTGQVFNVLEEEGFRAFLG